MDPRTHRAGLTPLSPEAPPNPLRAPPKSFRHTQWPRRDVPAAASRVCQSAALLSHLLPRADLRVRGPPAPLPDVLNKKVRKVVVIHSWKVGGPGAIDQRSEELDFVISKSLAGRTLVTVATARPEPCCAMMVFQESSAAHATSIYWTPTLRLIQF